MSYCPIIQPCTVPSCARSPTVGTVRDILQEQSEVRWQPQFAYNNHKDPLSHIYADRKKITENEDYKETMKKYPRKKDNLSSSISDAATDSDKY